jgi:predicted dehydrogenase
LSKKLRFGVIGAGGFAEICHVPGLQSHPQAEVVALCGRRKDYATAMAQRLGVPDVHTDYRELVERDDVDGVAIVTPNVSHAEIAIAALQNGKHVMCEKPLAMNAAEAKAMLDAANASGKIHLVAFTFRYLHCLQKLKEMLHAGAIGAPHYVRVRGEGMGGLSPDFKAGWREVMSLSGGGLIQDMGSHYVDLVNCLVAPIAEVCGTLLNIPRTRPNAVTGEPTLIDADDLNAAFFRTTTNVLGDYLLSRITPGHGEWGFEVVGDEGALLGFLTRGNRDELKRLRVGGDWENVPLPDEAKIHEPLALGRMMRSFVDAILRGASDGVWDATFEDGTRAQVALDAIVQSVKEKRWVEVAA